MANTKKLVIIGGTACGPKTAARARRCDPGATITVIEQGRAISTATCGFPYFVSGLIRSKSSLLVQNIAHFKNTMGIDVHVNSRAHKIDRRNHMVEFGNIETGNISNIEYDKLVIATGSNPVIPDIEGIHLDGIFTMTRLDEAEKIQHFISKHKVSRAVIIGAGFIGMEMAEAFASLNIKVEIIEALDWVMPSVLDFEPARYLERYLLAQGIMIHCGQQVTGFHGDKKDMVTEVVTTGGTIRTDTVLLAVGTVPNIQLAYEAGLKTGERGGISVDGYMRTSDPDIYAGGDCVENLHRLTGRKVLAPLGSTANKHGRIIGTNITGGNELFPGIMGTSIAKIFEFNTARTGLTEKEAWTAGFSVVTSMVVGNEHATYYPGSRDFLVKMIADTNTGKVLGAQMIGKGEVSKRIDVVETAISFGATAHDISNLDLSYAPPYNSAIDPVHHAANTILNKISGIACSITPGQVKAKMDKDEDFVLLDVRSFAEWEDEHIKARQVMVIPLDLLREKFNTIPYDKEIIIICYSSVRAFNAQRILNGAGFTNVKFMDGSLAAWPFETSRK